MFQNNVIYLGEYIFSPIELYFNQNLFPSITKCLTAEQNFEQIMIKIKKETVKRITAAVTEPGGRLIPTTKQFLIWHGEPRVPMVYLESVALRNRNNRIKALYYKYLINEGFKLQFISVLEQFKIQNPEISSEAQKILDINRVREFDFNMCEEHNSMIRELSQTLNISQIQSKSLYLAFANEYVLQCLVHLYKFDDAIVGTIPNAIRELDQKIQNSLDKHLNRSERFLRITAFDSPQSMEIWMGRDIELLNNNSLLLDAKWEELNIKIDNSSKCPMLSTIEDRQEKPSDLMVCFATIIKIIVIFLVSIIAHMFRYSLIEFVKHNFFFP